jgi:hypothetical protein
LLLVLTALACGRRGPVRPPEDILPAPISDLQAKQAAGGVELTWGRPTTYVDGSRMLDLGRFDIQRAGNGEDFTSRTIVEVSDRDRFRQVKRFRYLDREITPGSTYRYRVVTSTLDGYVSAPSNIVTVEITSDSGETDAPLPPAQR